VDTILFFGGFFGRLGLRGLIFFSGFGMGQTVGGQDFGFEFVHHIEIVPEELFGLFATLADNDVAVAEEGAGFFNQVMMDAQIDQIALGADAAVEHDVKFGIAEGGSDLVLHDAGPDMGADGAGGILDGIDAPNVYADGTVKFEGAAAGSGFRIAEHDADFFADLVDKDEAGSAFVDGGGEFSHRLAHQAGLQAYMRISDIPVDFRLGDQGGDGIDNDDN